MSVWTHVAGIIRADGININDNAPQPDWDKIVGKEVLWASGTDVWEEYENHPERFMPCGSEGSLKKVIWTNPNKHSMAAYTISVFGDLRDYGDLDAIAKWFEDTCKQLWIRNAVLTVECELGSRLTAYWDTEHDKLIQTKET
jgi:hypothetical protein